MITYIDTIGVPKAEPGIVPSIMEKQGETTKYDTWVSAYDDGILLNANRYVCYGNNTGSTLEYALDNGVNLDMVDEMALKDCLADDPTSEGVILYSTVCK